MTASMFGPISVGRNKGYLTDKITILNWFLSFKLSKVNCVGVTLAWVLHLPECYTCPGVTLARVLHLPGCYTCLAISLPQGAVCTLH
jgi:hypothetical protein